MALAGIVLRIKSKFDEKFTGGGFEGGSSNLYTTCTFLSLFFYLSVMKVQKWNQQW